MNYLKKAAVCMTVAAMLAANSVGFMPYESIELPAITANAADIVDSGSCGAEGDNVTWTLDSEDTLTISGEGEMKDYTFYFPHWTEYENLNKVIIEDGVTSIGYAAFYGCSNLISIAIPESVTSIGREAFAYCDKLTSITIPKNIEKLIGAPFINCYNLSSIVIENPNCIIIDDSVATICNTYDFDTKEAIFNGTIYGYTGSTAQEYAEKYNRTFIALDDEKDSDTTVTSGECGLKGNNVTWTLDSEGTLTISGEGKMKSYLNSSAPWEAESINKVVIENGVTSIGYNSFDDCKNLTSVSFPDSLISIDGSAFWGCENLSEITIPSSVTEIGGHAFYDTLWLENKRKESPLVIVNNILIDAQTCTDDVVIPDNVVCIGEDAFFNNSSITSVIIPSSVKAIKSSAFSYCKNLSEITIPGSVGSIGNLAFYNCKNMTSVTIEEGVTLINGSSFRGCESLTSITLPETLTSISIDAFSSCTSLKTITIPIKVTRIGSQTFSECSSLESIVIKNPKCVIDNSLSKPTIPDTATIYGYEGSTAQEYAEKNSIQFIALDDEIDPDTIISSGECGADGSNVTWELNIAGTLTISGEGAMYKKPWSISEWDTDISKVIIEDGITSIPETAFAFHNINEIIIPDSVTSIGSYAFINCDKLTEITLPKNLTKIDNSAFMSCSSLKSIKIPANVAEIGTAPFSGCSSLSEILVDEKNKDFVSVGGVLYSKNMDRLINYPMGNPATSVSISDKITSIDSNAFNSAKNLSEIIIPTSVTSIGGYAFHDTEWLENKRKENPLVIINDLLIDGQNCENEVVIPDNVKSISSMAFSNCDGLTSIIIPDSVTHIGTEAFRYCNNLNSIKLSESITSIDEFMFWECTNLSTITIPNSVESIGNHAFADCKSLESITFKNPDCKIYDDKTAISDTATIYGYEGSTAQAYAEKYNRTFIALDESSETTPVTTAAIEAATSTTTTTTATITEPTTTTSTTVTTTKPTTTKPTTTTSTVTTTATITSTTTTAATTTAPTTTTPPTTTEPYFVIGDVNEDGKVDSVDASLVLAEYALIQTGGELTFTEKQKNAADVNKDGKTDSSDASKILEYYAAISTGKDPSWD